MRATLNTYADLWPDRLDDVTSAMTRQRSLALDARITTGGLSDGADRARHDGIMTRAADETEQAPDTRA